MIDPKKKPKAKVPEVIEPHIKPDAPGTQPGDVGNGHVLVIDARTQRFNGVNYRLHATGNYVRGGADPLHIEVWKYHNGERPKGYVVHHDHRNPDGSFDKNENNIEWLRLMSKVDHSMYHLQRRQPVKRICPQCGKEFETANTLQKYCTKSCARRHARDNSLVTRVCPVCKKTFRVACSSPMVACSSECEAELRRTKMPIAYEQFLTMPPANKSYPQGEMVMRICPICGKAFPASRSKSRIACSPECGAIVAGVARAHRRATEEQMHWNGEFLNLVNKVIGVEIRAQIIKGEPWFVAKDVCDALDIKNSRDAVARLDDDEKQIINVATQNVGSNDVSTTSRNPNMNFVNESGLYSLIFVSRKPEAKEFKRWITHKVLPALRKYGRYVMEEENALLATTENERRLLDGYQSLTDSDRQLVDFIISRNFA